MNVITEIRLALRLKPILDQMKELLKMKLSVNVILQILALVVQGANQLGGFVPEKYRPVVALAVGVLQSVIALIAHFSPVPGTAKK